MARRGVASGTVPGPWGEPFGPEHTFELSARARRANLLVRERETPARPQPRQDVRAVDEFGWSVEVMDTSGDRVSAYVVASGRGAGRALPHDIWYGHLCVVVEES